MLFKLSVSNIRKSLRDYAIYFFTLIIGVSVFYVFNAIEGQTAMIEMSESRREVISMLKNALSAVSVFVAGVLGLLIVYADRFLMKRRSKEFGLYMTLGMSKSRISAILLTETILIGLGSLILGLIIGIGLSQLMSAFVVNLFDADMSAYRFTVSGKAIIKTIIYFAVMYLVAMLFNSAVISRFKLIDLLQSEKKSEQIKLRSPFICVIIFIAASVMLGYAYYHVGIVPETLDTAQSIVIYIAMGAAATFLIFRSVAGMLLRIIMSMKNVYHKGLNAFTFRQISSKINTMVFSMTVICLMLFVTICTLSAAFSLRNTMNSNIRELCPADINIVSTFLAKSDRTDDGYEDIIRMCEDNGYDITSDFSKYEHFCVYSDSSYTFGISLGREFENAKQQYPYLIYDTPVYIIALSDYNSLMELFGREKLSLNEDEYAVICNLKLAQKLYDAAFAADNNVTIFGKELSSKYNKCIDSFINIASTRMNDGMCVVPDSVIDTECKVEEHLTGIYASSDKKSAEEKLREDLNSAQLSASVKAEKNEAPDSNYLETMISSKIEISESSVGLGAICTFLSLYIGMVFLIACGAVLALKELSESVDNIGRYAILRKIGVEEKDISASLFIQSGIFFLLPLIVACLHSVFGLKFAIFIFEVFGTDGMTKSVVLTALLILLIYGGYFLITFLCSKNIIKEKK